MWCYRRMEKISWACHTKTEVLHIVKEEWNALHTIKRMKYNWIGHILCGKCLLNFIEGNIAGTGRRGGRSMQLLDDVK